MLNIWPCSIRPYGIAISIAVSALLGQQSQPPAIPLTPQELQAENRDRERLQRATDILKALEIYDGDWVADVGAGNGYYVQRMADLVGPKGKVFAEDIADHAIEWLHQRVKVYDLYNVEVVKGNISSPDLPENSLSAVLVVNAYHHFQHHQPMLEQIFKSLKPGGRLVIADYTLPLRQSESRTEQAQDHRIDPELVKTEVSSVGFRVLKCENPFLKRMPEVTRGDRIGSADMWLMTAVRPK